MVGSGRMFTGVVAGPLAKTGLRCGLHLETASHSTTIFRRSRNGQAGVFTLDYRNRVALKAADPLILGKLRTALPFHRRGRAKGHVRKKRPICRIGRARNIFRA